jgi:hypothetical protein
MRAKRNGRLAKLHPAADGERDFMTRTKYRFKDRAEAEAQVVKAQEEADHYGIALRASMLDTWDGYACGTEGRKWYAIVALPGTDRYMANGPILVCRLGKDITVWHVETWRRRFTEDPTMIRSEDGRDFNTQLQWAWRLWWDYGKFSETDTRKATVTA